MTYGSNNNPTSVSFTQGVDNQAEVAKAQISKALLAEGEARVALENANFRLVKATEMLKSAEITYRESVSKSVWNKDEIRKSYNEAIARFRDADKKVIEATENFTKAQNTVSSLRSIAKGEVVKREFSPEKREALAEKGHAMPDGSFPIESRNDLKNAISSVGRAKDYDATKKHIIEQAKRLKLTDDLPENWKSPTATMKSVADVFKGDVEGHAFHGNQYTAGSGGGAAEGASGQQLVQSAWSLAQRAAKSNYSEDIVRVAQAHRDASAWHMKQSQTPNLSEEAKKAHELAAKGHSIASNAWSKIVGYPRTDEQVGDALRNSQIASDRSGRAFYASPVAKAEKASIVCPVCKGGSLKDKCEVCDGEGKVFYTPKKGEKPVEKADVVLVVCPACHGGDAMKTCEYCDGEGKVPADGEQDDTMESGEEDNTVSDDSGFTTKSLLHPLIKGDVAGHEFHGNQYSAGQGGGSSHAQLAKEHMDKANELARNAGNLVMNDQPSLAQKVLDRANDHERASIAHAEADKNPSPEASQKAFDLSAIANKGAFDK